MCSEVKEGQHGYTLINDSYNSDFNLPDITLDFMNRCPDYRGRHRILILSNILRSNDTGKDLCDKVTFLCEKRGAKEFIGIGEGPLTQRSAFRRSGEKYFSTAVNSLIHSDILANLHGEVILLKGI